MSLSIATIISIAIPLSIMTGILGYYILMPGWLFVDRVVIDPKNPPAFGNAFGITESDLSRYPALKKAIEQADRAYPSNHTPAVMASNYEAIKLRDRLQLRGPGNSNHFFVISGNNDNDQRPKIYFMRIVFGYEQPLIQ